jgi:uncharacterized membrane protein YfcA
MTVSDWRTRWTTTSGGCRWPAWPGLACGFLNTAASSGSAVSLPILMAIGLDPVTANATNRLPVLIGAMSATGSFHRKRAIPWHDALVVAVPVTAGAGVGAVLAEVIPARDLALVITAAVLVAMLLLFTKLKSAIANAEVRDARLGAREIAIFTFIGLWLGFIVLDGATYLLLALTLAVGLPLVQANAVKTFALVPTSLLALVIFAAKGHVDWEVGAVMAVTAIAGGNTRGQAHDVADDEHGSSGCWSWSSSASWCT